jgi:hypothetical protein
MSHVVVRDVSQLSVTDLVRLCLAAEIQLNQAQSEMREKTEGSLKISAKQPQRSSNSSQHC